MPETAAIVTALIIERPLCIECVKTKASIGAAELDDALSRIAVVLDLIRNDRDRCRTCGRVGGTVSLVRPSN
jgi:hypothetical protein